MINGNLNTYPGVVIDQTVTPSAWEKTVETGTLKELQGKRLIKIQVPYASGQSVYVQAKDGTLPEVVDVPRRKDDEEE